MKIQSVEFTRAAHSPKDFPRDGLPQIAFGGRSNVGKSSLINTLLRRKGLARTSSSPGRTRSINFFLVNRRFYFVDLPGYGYAKISKSEREQWAELVERYLRSIEAAGPDAPPQARVVLLVDGKIGGSPLDAEAARYLAGFDLDLTIAVTKIDRVSRNQRHRRLAKVAGLLQLERDVRSVSVSAQTGEGLTELWSELDLA